MPLANVLTRYAAVGLLAGLLGAGLAPPTSLPAAESLPAGHKAPSTGYTTDIQPLVEANCIRCHGAKKQKADINFSLFTDDASIKRSRKIWKKAIDALESGDMPPEESKEQPTPDERRKLVDWMKRVRDGGFDDPASRDPGPPIIRRLTINEYNRTLRDLLGIDVNVSDIVGMPDDATSSGFKNLAAALNVSDSLMEKYFSASQQALEQVFVTADPELASLEFHRDRNRAKGAHDKLVFVQPGGELSAHQAAEQVLKKFVRRAYRRPVTNAELGRYLALFDSLEKEGKNYETAVRMTMAPVLVSPNFLFRLERDRCPAGSSEAAKIDDHELAVRLSYFLWSTMPDEALFKAADEGKLSDPPALDEQITRMLADPKARALTDGFGAQWLKIDKAWSARPSTEFFPTFTNQLKGAMQDEAFTFFDHLRTDDQPILDLLDSDYTYLNQTLAENYGIPDVKGEKMVRVQLKSEYHRGGLLGMGAILASTSHTFRTSPTLRGKYVLDVLFGTPPDPPPANVGQIKDEKAKGQTIHTFRDQLAQHANDATCAACHKKMDPLGFALDNYDAIGRWRESDGSGPLDVTGKLPTGESLVGVDGLKKLVLSRRDQFVTSAIEHTMSYALGREVDYYDAADVRRIQKNLTDNGFRFSTLIKELVKSDAFEYRRNLAPGEDGAGHRE